MDHDFWHSRWETGRIGFHRAEVNPLLVEFLPALALPKGSRIFVPLCGKTIDIRWLLSKGFQVVGVELSEMAIDELFENLGAEPQVSSIGALKHYHAPSLDIFVGDAFALTAEVLGQVDAVYDRAALVALPSDMRVKYTELIRDVTNTAPQLLVTFDYDQSQMDGPPFSISAAEVKSHYGQYYQIALLANDELTGDLTGRVSAKDNVWHLNA